MKKYIITAFAFATLLTGSITFTACEDIDDVQELSLDRLLSPTNLIGKISNKVDITASWDAMDGATSYTIEFYKEDPNCEGTPIVSETIESNSYTKTGLEGETEYTIRVKSISEEQNESKWSTILRTTDITDQIFKDIVETDLTDRTATLHWTPGETVTELLISWVDENKKTKEVTLEVTSEEAAAGCKVVSELLPETTYEARLKNGKKTRGLQTFTTLVDLSTVTVVSAGDNLLEVLDAASDGAQIVILTGEFDIDDYALTKSLSISGYYQSQRPIIHGRFNIGDVIIKSLKLSNLTIENQFKQDNLLEIKNANGQIDELEINGCYISELKKHFIYNGAKGNMGNITIKNCIIDQIKDNAGDGIDIRGGELKSLTVTNSTFSNGFRTFLRCQANNDAFTVTFTNCTFYNICTIDNSNNSGIFQMDKTTSNSELTVKQCIFYGIGVANPTNKASGVWSKTGKMKATETYEKNYYYNSPNLWASGQSTHESDHDKVATEGDPKFTNAEEGDFTISNSDMIGDNAGDVRWIK